MPPKKGKSSASSATRKKQAAKAAKKQGQDPNAAPQPTGGKNTNGPQRGQKKDKKSKKELKKKVFIPPPKPPQPPPDPLDTLGLASLLPPSLVILLRKAAKKDVITRSRALEGIIRWIDGNEDEGEDSANLTSEEREDALVMMLPSWTHLFPRLAASPTRRLRLMTAQILSRLLLPERPTRSELILSPQYIEGLLGPWSVLAWDTDRVTANTARQAWDKTVAWGSGDSQALEDRLLIEPHLPALASYFSSLLIHTTDSGDSGLPPLSRGTSFAAGGSIPGTPGEGGRDAKNRDDSNVEEDPAGIDARMGAGALGALAWVFSTTTDISLCEDVTNLLHAQDLWTSLLPSQSLGNDTSRSPIGLAFPITRSRAWSLLSTIVFKQPAVLTEILEAVSSHALQAAWTERDGSVQKALLDTILPLLMKHNEVWSIAAADKDAQDDEEQSEDDDDDDADEEEEQGEQEKDGQTATERSATHAQLAAFEKWLQTGCAGNPLQGLPSVLVLISTIPSIILKPYQESVNAFLDNFWLSYESGLYTSDPMANAEFFKAYAESSSYLIGKVSKQDPAQTASIADQQLGRVWTENIMASAEQAAATERRRTKVMAASIAKSEASVDEKVSSTLRNLAKLSEDNSLARPLLDVIFDSMTRVGDGSLLCRSEGLSRACNIFEASTASDSPAPLRDTVNDAVTDLAQRVSANVSASSSSSGDSALPSQVALLTNLLSSFPGQSWNSQVQAFASQSLPSLVSKAALPSELIGPFVRAYHSAAPSPEGSQLIASLVNSAATIQDTQLKIQILQSLLDGLPSDGLSDESLSSATQLDDVTTELAASIAEGKSFEGESLLSRLIGKPEPFIQAGTVVEILAILISRLHDLSRQAVIGRTGDLELAEKLATILGRWLSSNEGQAQLLEEHNLFEGLAFAAFHLSFLLAVPSPQARQIWSVISKRPTASQLAVSILKESVVDHQIEVPIVLHGAQRYFKLSNVQPPLRLMDIVPDPDRFDSLLTAASVSARPPASASILDPLIGQTSSHPKPVDVPDVQGFSPYTRSVYALLIALEESRSTARSHPWAIPHLVMLALACEDESQTPGGSGGLLDKEQVRSASSPQSLSGLCQRAVKTSSTILASLCADLPEPWHATSTETLLRKLDDKHDDPVLAMLADLWRLNISQATSSEYPARIFSRVLAGVLSFASAGEQDGSRWLRVATAIESKAPKLSEAIIFATKGLVYGTPIYDRQCSDIVSRLAGTPPSKAGSQGLTLLRLASAIAPPQESSLALVPQQRAIFCLQGLQRWFASDEDFEEEVNTRLAELFLHIAPIVQDLPGSHLDFFFDIVESNLEVADLSDDAALPGLYHTLKLLELLNNLSKDNAVLRDVAKEHKSAVLELLEPVFESLAEEDAKLRSHANAQEIPAAKETVIELLMSTVRQNHKTFCTAKHTATLCKLLGSPMREVQASAYRLLSGLIRSSVQELVFESALEKEGEERPRIAITGELLALAAKQPGVTSQELEESPEVGSAVMNYLLAWLAIFEHFEEATVQLKAIYAGELQKEGLLSASLLPCIFSLLEPQKARRQASTVGENDGPYNPERYSIEEVFVDLLEPSEAASLQQLATHIYLRALLYVPAMVRDWWVGIKDRQFSMAIANFTIRHCSPIIASRELSHVRDPDSKARLQDEAMSIKILGSSEVVATYTVDEHPMEIGVKIPHDYPLHGVEVRDIRRVGVSESQWRAWLLAVQQLIVGQNGLIVDALMLFKRNAEAKFSGFEGAECSICYSIISPTDRSLPTKPCKTCSNKFHASCLYKWVTTSGNSTCPLCRSIL
ncbi:unnamed protein product [Sympodiomycopsis kandeliae]